MAFGRTLSPGSYVVDGSLFRLELLKDAPGNKKAPEGCFIHPGLE